MTNQIKTLLSLSFVLSLQVSAQEYSEQSLKTLFTNPQERQMIDGNRSNHSSSDQVLATPSSVQINGIVKRSNGKSVVWVNGKNTMDTTMTDGIKVYSGSIKSNNKVPVLIDGKKIYIKPGETWSEDAGVSDVGK